MEGTFEKASPEIVKFIDGRYRTIAKKQSRAICGLSMGGFHTLYITLNNPDMFNYSGTHFATRGADAREVFGAHSRKALHEQRVVDHLEFQRGVFGILDRQRRLGLAELDAEFVADGPLHPVVDQLGRTGEFRLHLVLELAETLALDQVAGQGKTGAFDIERVVRGIVDLVARLEVARRVDVLHPRLLLRLGAEGEGGGSHKQQKNDCQFFHRFI